MLFRSWLATASARGGCNGVLTNNNTGAPSNCGGATTVTFTYTSTCAPLTTTAQATFTVPAPATVVLTAPVNSSTLSGAYSNQAAADAAFSAWLATASASGGCNGVLTNNNTGAPFYCGGVKTVTFTYTSTCVPLTTTAQATFTITGSSPVVVSTPTPINNTLSACSYSNQDAANAAFAIWLAQFSVVGGINPTGIFTPIAPIAPAYCGGSTTVTYTVTDRCYDTSTHVGIFTITPSTPVVLTAPVNTTTTACQTQAAVNTAYAAWLATATASGGCNGVLTNNGNTDNGGAPSSCGGSRTVTFTYTNTCVPLTTTAQATFTVPAQQQLY